MEYLLCVNNQQINRRNSCKSKNITWSQDDVVHFVIIKVNANFSWRRVGDIGWLKATETCLMGDKQSDNYQGQYVVNYLNPLNLYLGYRES
jgi:hypothetical protein